MQRSPLKRGISIGMLQEEPRAMRSLGPDKSTSWPAVFGQDGSHPFEIRNEHGISSRGGGADTLACLDLSSQLSLHSLVCGHSGSDFSPQRRQYFALRPRHAPRLRTGEDGEDCNAYGNSWWQREDSHSAGAERAAGSEEVRARTVEWSTNCGVSLTPAG
jgi:hypothetical protein